MRQQTILRGPSGSGEGSDALRAQILATEHWSLLATRSMTWTEIFSRTATFLTVVSATVIALSLVAQGSGFGKQLHVVAAIILPVVLAVGLATFLRLVEADVEDTWLIIGMNRIRHAYLELAPDLERYFVTSSHDDGRGVMRTYAFRDRVGVWHWLSGSPLIVAVIDAAIFGVLVATLVEAADVGGAVQVVSGVAAGLLAMTALAVLGRGRVTRLSSAFQPRFPAQT